MSKLLRLSKYCQSWANDFTKINIYLKSFLENSYLQIHHIGSTSIPSMMAKPIIDIDIEYTHNFKIIKYLLEDNNYLFEGDKGISNRYSFKYLKNDLPQHHLYVIKSGSESLINHLSLKRILLNNPLYRNQYSNLKKQLINNNNVDRELYTNSKTDLIIKLLLEEKTMKTIIFAGGCFWGVEAYFKQLNGVIETEAGYINGVGETTYEKVCNLSGHAEAVIIKYDNEVISLKKLLDHFFNIIDPTSVNKQGNDVGIQYRTGIYNYTFDQLPFIRSYFSIRQKEYRRPIAIELATNLPFYKAEEAHQDYLDKNQSGYCHIDLSSHKDIK